MAWLEIVVRDMHDGDCYDLMLGQCTSRPEWLLRSTVVHVLLPCRDMSFVLILYCKARSCLANNDLQKPKSG